MEREREKEKKRQKQNQKSRNNWIDHVFRWRGGSRKWEDGKLGDQNAHTKRKQTISEGFTDVQSISFPWFSAHKHTQTRAHTHTQGMTAGCIMNTVIGGNISDGSSLLILNNQILIFLSLTHAHKQTHFIDFLRPSDILTEWKSRLLKEQIRGLEKEHFPLGQEDFNYNGEPCLAKKRNK